jgi:hypothetical protein
MKFHLAQANVGRMRAPLEDPGMDGFRLELPRINAVADAAPGFVWRLQTEGGDATSIREWGDPLIIVNMSVWTSLEALHRYVYASDHVAQLRTRKQFFHPFNGPMLVLWWIPEGHVPTVAEAKAKLEHLAARGPSPEAFTFRRPFPAPGAALPGKPPEVDAEFCWGPA